MNLATGLPSAVADLSPQFVMGALYPATDASYDGATDAYQFARADLSATSVGQIDAPRSVALLGSSPFVLDGRGTGGVRDLSDTSGS